MATTHHALRRGIDLLSGGAGSDIFIVSTLGGARITDFDEGAGHDRILLAGLLGQKSDAARIRAISTSTAFDADGATVDLGRLGGSGHLRIDGVDASSFGHAGDFLFG